MFSLTVTLPVRCVPLPTGSGYSKIRLCAVEEQAGGVPGKWLSNASDKTRSAPEKSALKCHGKAELS